MRNILKILLANLLVIFICNTLPGNVLTDSLLADPSLKHASVSIYIADTETGEIVLKYNPEESLVPASLMKLVTSAAALELLGADYQFTTVLDYSGSIDKKGILTGDIIIRGGCDPALGSKYFKDHYNDFIGTWVEEIKKAGINKIEGRVITDDSYYDYNPVPPKWIWEDIGNYYGAGVYGLSAFDNTYEIHINSSFGENETVITEIVPKECTYNLINRLVPAGTKDKGYVFAAPYSTTGWIEGTIPEGKTDFILKASVTDPPLLVATMLTNRLKETGISVLGEPTTVRLNDNPPGNTVLITETISPQLKDIIYELNHESINLYAEHLVKELGKRYKNQGSTTAGLDVIMSFLKDAGINTEGIFIEDGSGLSHFNAINAKALVNLLIFMKERGICFNEYYSSLPDAGKNGTLKYYFKDKAFDSMMKAKSGSMTRVRNYSGYLNTDSGKTLAFGIIINNYTGTTDHVISIIETLIKNIILFE